MNILILGATGFIGNSIFHSLVADHNITIAGRTPIDGYSKWRYADFLKEIDEDSLLKDIDLVVNAIGIIDGDFNRIQSEAPSKLYKACIEKGIRVLHISAIGADKNNPPTEFLSSKKKTDELLLNYNKAKVIYPGIVIGDRGRSSQFFAELAQFPIIPIFQMTGRLASRLVVPMNNRRPLSCSMTISSSIFMSITSSSISRSGFVSAAESAVRIENSERLSRMSFVDVVV